MSLPLRTSDGASVWDRRLILRKQAIVAIVRLPPLMRPAGARGAGPKGRPARAEASGWSAL
jgi:hypothetical protein